MFVFCKALGLYETGVSGFGFRDIPVSCVFSFSCNLDIRIS